MSQSHRPGAPDDDWGRYARGRDHFGRDVWVRPRHMAERHETIEHLEPRHALAVLERWTWDDFRLVESLHDRAHGPPADLDPDRRREKMLDALTRDVEMGRLVFHRERLEPGAAGTEPVQPAPPPDRPPATPWRPASTWIEVALVEGDTPVRGERVLIVDPAGQQHVTPTNDEGVARVEGIEPGICDVSFPRIDGREWVRRGGRFGGSGSSTPVIVSRGQHASFVAKRSGLRALDTVWSHPDNAELRARRDANLLVPGDTVAVPSREDRVEDCATTLRHVFVVRRGRLGLRLRFEQPRGEPWQAGQCDVVVRQDIMRVQRDAGGALSIDVPMDVQQVEVGGVFDDKLALWTGDLEPVETGRGVCQRLLDLGLLDAEEGTPAALRAALEEFQCDEGLSVTGEADASTRARLREVHGC